MSLLDSNKVTLKNITAGGHVAGRDINITNSNDLAMCKEVMLEVNEEFQKLKRVHNVTEEAIKGFFDSLQAENVPLEKLSDELTSIAHKYIQILDKLDVLADDDKAHREAYIKAKNSLREGQTNRHREYLKEIIDSKKSSAEKALQLENEAADAKNRDLLLTADITAQLASSFALDFDYTQALVYFNEAQNTLSMIDNKTTKTLSISAYCFNESGMILLKLKQYTNAISHFTKSIEKIANLQDHRPQTAIYTNNLGMCYFENGDPAMALQHFKSSEKLEKRIFGNDYLKLIKRYINIGNCFSKLGDQAKAEFYYETALAKAIKDSKSNFPDVGVAKSNLGLHLLSRNENQQAIALLKDALSADKAFYGRSHPTVAKRHFNLGHALIQNEKYELAIRELEDALEIESQILDGNHPDLAITLEELAQAYLRSRDFLKSYNCLDGALAINLKNFGKNSYEVALNFKITGLVHLESGQNNSGITYLLDSIRIAENLPTKPIGLILELYNILGNYYSSIQDTLLSEKNFNKVLKLLEKESSIKNPSTANIYCSLGHYFNSKQDFNKAYNCFYEAFNIDTKFFPNDHPNNIRDRHYLAEALYDLGENKKSIELIRLNIKILDKLPRERGEEYIREYNFLGLIYYESGEFEKAINKYRRAFMLANKFLGGSDEITIKIKTQLNDAITASRRR